MAAAKTLLIIVRNIDGDSWEEFELGPPGADRVLGWDFSEGEPAWFVPGGGGAGSPGGDDGEIQYNDNGSFGGLASTGTGSVVRAASPALTGNPTAPTQTAGNNSTRIATTEFVQAALAGVVQVLEGEVEFFADLPDATEHDGEDWLVRKSSGTMFETLSLRRRKGGVYFSEGGEWKFDGDATEAYFQDTLAWSNLTSKPDLLEWVAVPATDSSPGTPGQAAYEAGYLYICVDTDDWGRVALNKWS